MRGYERSTVHPQIADYDMKHIVGDMFDLLSALRREACADLVEVTVPSGHWTAQEKPSLVNAALAKWLALKFPQRWPV